VLSSIIFHFYTTSSQRALATHLSLASIFSLWPVQSMVTIVNFTIVNYAWVWSVIMIIQP